jgi:hypothetical protein
VGTALCSLTLNGSWVECACQVPLKKSNKENCYCPNCQGALQDSKTVKRHAAKAGNLNSVTSAHEDHGRRVVMARIAASPMLIVMDLECQLA